MLVDKSITTEGVREQTWSVLEALARQGARTLLQQALENEVAEYIEAHAAKRDEKGHRLAVRNGTMPERSILTGMGPMDIRQPRVDDRKLKEQEEAERFSSKILPRYLRRVPSVDNLIPVLYLKGVSSKEFLNALSSILGEGAKGLSATNIVRLKKGWEQEYKGWAKRDLSEKEYVYIWADGVYFNIRLEDQRSCILVIMGCNLKGEKELLALSDGFRESELSWTEMLRDLKARGLKIPPKLAIGDGALGFWAALGKEFPETKWQRCWVHKTANVLDKLPKGLQGKAKSMIHEMYMADTKENALKAYRHFVDVYSDKYPKAVECLKKDEEVLFSFYDFPAAHWIHIRTTNPIESTFATVRLRTARTKGCGSRIATLTMVFKLVMEAQKNWRRLTGSSIIPMVLSGRKFVDGILEQDVA
ncbi:IS256 family transposase ISWch1 [subsurface metagenome]